VSGIQFQCTDPEAAYGAIRSNGGIIVDEPWSVLRGEATITRAVIAKPDWNEFTLL
jgi:predicted enzyme related to lactoylglutathione lyase